MSAQTSEHLIRRAHYVTGREDERERIVKLLEAERDKFADLANFPPDVATMNYQDDAHLVNALIALITGETE